MSHSRPLAAVIVATSLSVAALAQSNSIVDGTRTPAPAAQATQPDLSPQMRGDIFMARKMYREAIEAFREGPAKDAVLLNKTGIAYHQLMQLDKAKKSYEQALKAKGDYVEAMNNIGTVYYAQKSYRRAISWYNKALQARPEPARSASVYMNLGTAYFARKKYEDATKCYQMAMTIDPEVFERRGTYGVMLEERRVEERAKYHFYLAKLYATGGRNELAMQYLRKALEEGFTERKKLEEPEFAALRELPEYKELMAKEQRVL
jgi:tetratricopeptide (TPR) repeat protein